MHCLRRPERAHPRHAGEIDSARPSRGPAQGPPPRLATNPLFTAFFNPLTKQRLHRRPRGAVSRFGYTQYSMTPPSRQPHRHHHLIPLNAPQHTSKRFCNRATRFLVLHTVDQQLLIISMSLIDSTPVGGAGSKTQKVELEHLFIRRRRERFKVVCRKVWIYLAQNAPSFTSFSTRQQPRWCHRPQSQIWRLLAHSARFP